MIRILSVLLAVMMFAACSDDSTGPEQPTPLRSLTEAESSIARSNTDFAFTLFRTTAQTQPDDNIFLSPLSVSMALGMTMNGAAGDTRAAMQQTLMFNALTQQEINEAYRGLIDLLTHTDPRVALRIGNSIWGREGFPIRQDFIDTNRHYFNAEVASLDFDDPQSVDIINDWVSESTQGRIPTIIDPPIPPEVMLYLINAVYFKGTWTTQFDPSRTRDDTFSALSGAKQSVRMMNREGRMRYHADAVMEVVDLPYGWDRYSMTVVLPRQGYTLAQAAEALSSGWTGILEKLVTTEMTLQLPRFTLEYEVALKDILSAMGMGIAFDPGRADFTGINSGGDLYITRVKHKTFVEVNEEGTEAAAATSVEVGLTSVPSVMRVDRPFLFLIHERHSGAILFIGQVTELAS
ncbi:MAG: serpin family protein [Bacteroidetes bacterium]|nr:serpin family protein [Bacteroidota bacterium]